MPDHTILPAGEEETKSNHDLSAVHEFALQLETLRRDFFKMKASFDYFTDSMDDQNSNWDSLHTFITKDLASSLQEFSEASRLRQEIYQLSCSLDNWQKSAISFFKSMENTLSHPQIESTYRRAVEKCTIDFQKIIMPLGLDVIRPQLGDEFDSRIHRVVEEQPSDNVPEGKILSCSGWGYRSGSIILESAEIVLSKGPGCGDPKATFSIAGTGKAKKHPLRRFSFYGITLILVGLVIYAFVRPDSGRNVSPCSASDENGQSGRLS